jgi:hypothetical protein
MVSLLPLVVALAGAVASPGPTPTPPTPLTVIGTTRTNVCAPIVAHADNAIGAALEGNRDLTILTNNLRNTDYGNMNENQQRLQRDTWLREASAIRMSAKAALDEIKALRAEAAQSTDPTRKAELTAFADALGGALGRQDRAAADFVGSVTVVQGREARGSMDEVINNPNLGNQPVPGGGGLPGARSQGVPTPMPGPGVTIMPPAPTPDQYNRIDLQLAQALSDKTTDILRDEGVAANHSLGITSGC